MKFNIVELIRSAFVKRDQKFRQHLTVFFICLLIAIFVWFTVKMDNEYQEIIPVSLKFTSAPKSRVLVSASDTMIYVELNEKGSELLRYRYLNSHETLEVSTRNVILTHHPDKSTGYLLTTSLSNDIGYQHDLAGKVVSISPDTIFFEFKKETFKKVPVSADIQVKTQKQFMIYGNVDYEPDSVIVRGPEDMLESISKATLGTIDRQDLDRTTQISLPVLLDKQYRFVSAIPEEVTVTIPVEKFTETVIEVPVNVITDTSIQIRLFPDAVKIYCLVALKDYTQVTPGIFKAVADFRTVDIERENEIRIRIAEVPSTIRIVRIEPEKAEYIIIK